MLEGSPGTINLPHHDMKQGRFQEYDFLPNGQFAPVLRSFGQNICGVVVGIINNATAKTPAVCNVSGLVQTPQKPWVLLLKKNAHASLLPLTWRRVSISPSNGSQYLLGR